MESDDIPLVVPLQQTVDTLFRDVFSELTFLHENLISSEQQQVVDIIAVTLPPPDEIAQESVPHTSEGKRKPPGKPDNKKKESIAVDSADDLAVIVANRKKRELEETVRQTVVQKRDAYVTTAFSHISTASLFLTACEPSATYTKKRLAYFCSKPAGEFLIEDVLGEWAEDEFPSMLPDLCICPFAIARDHNKRLEATYGYKPPRLLHEVGKVTPRKIEHTVLQDRIASHDAGGTDPHQFVCAATITQNVATDQLALELSKKEASQIIDVSNSPLKKSKTAAQAAAKGLSSTEEKTQHTKPAISCSVSSIYLTAHPLQSAETVIELWNSEAHRYRLRLSPQSSATLLVAPAPGTVYDPNVPVNSGDKKFFRVVFTPQDYQTITKSYEIQFGYAREVNPGKQTELDSQWQFLVIPVTVTTVMPKLSLVNSEQRSMRFKPNFVFAEGCYQDFSVVNSGSSGEFFVTLEDAYGKVFSCEPSKFILNHKEQLTLNVKFRPTSEANFIGKVFLYSTLDTTTPVEVVELEGEGVLPRVAVQSIDSLPCAVNDAQDNADATFIIVLNDAAVANPTSRMVTVRNTCQLPVAFEWVTTLSDPTLMSSVIIPSKGVFPPHTEVGFHMEITPNEKSQLSALMSLFLTELPVVPEGFTANDNVYDTDGCGACISYLSREKSIPIIPQTQKLAVSSAESLEDPYGLFSNSDAPTPADSAARQNPTTTPSVFTCAIRLVADMEDMVVTANPSLLQSSLPSMVHSTTKRDFVLVNSCSREATFWLDPPLGDFHPATVAITDPKVHEKYLRTTKKIKEQYGASWKSPMQRGRAHESLTFFPQRGTIPGHSRVTVTVDYILKTVGSHHIDIECYIHELGVELSPHVTLTVEAVGPLVNVEPRLIDYGVIPLGEEGEGRITVTNLNCVPVEFYCQDILRHHDPPRFVFLPRGGMLLAGEKIDITAYRQGLKVEAAADVFEVVVVNGNTERVEIRASVQQAAASVFPSIVEFGNVDNNMPSQQQFFITNLTAVDLPYEFVVLSQDKGLKLKIPEGGMLFAGQQRVPMLLKAVFSGSKPLCGVIALVSQKLPQPIPFEVRCTTIQQLFVAFSITGPNGSQNPIRLTQSIDTYIRDLLHTVVGSILNDHKKASSFCAPLQLPYAEISEDEPFCAVVAKISVENTSGCQSGYRVFTNVLTPMMSEYRVAPPGPDYQLRNNSVFTRSTSMAGVGSRNSFLQSRGSVLKRSNSVNSTGTGTSGTSQKIVALAVDVPAFQNKAITGVELIEQSKKGLLKAAQNILQDGRGCAVQLANANNSLKPYQSQEITATFIANLPGEYTDNIQVMVDGCPDAEIPISIVVRGKPILVDPTTSGLGPDAHSGKMRLLLPEVVAGMTSIRRKLRITSRCPRDLDVHVVLVDQGSFFRVSLDTPHRANMLDAASATSGKIASPHTFLLGALDSTEILIEYTAPHGTKGDWRANLTIYSTIAASPFNDVFLIDEFYSKNRVQYPAVRQISSSGMPSNKHEVRGIPKIDVLRPLIDRPGIVHDSKFVELNQYQIRLTETLKRKVAQAASGERKSGADGESDDEGIDVVGNGTPRQEGDISPRSNRQLLLDDKERQELRDFLKVRQNEQKLSSINFFTETVLEIVAQNADAKLTCDPSQMLRFPMCKAGGKCDRVLRVQNPTRTPLDFRIAVENPFRITDIRFLPADDVEPTLLEDEAGLGKSSMPKTRIEKTSMKATANTTMMNTKRKDPNSDPAATLFHLKPRDSIDVTVELSLEGTITTSKHQIDGQLRILYQGGKEPQTLPMLATVHVPTVVCEPPMTWFRPTVEIRDGKPQPQHDRIIRLVNYSVCDAPFELEYCAAARTISRGNESCITRLQKVNQALQPTPLEMHSNVIDDPSRFIISPMNGVVPAATSGGVPGHLNIVIGFSGAGNTSFECKYKVNVPTGVGYEFSVRGDSRDTEI